MKHNSSSPENLVTTEPQRQALEKMSQDLITKLNIMVAEQNERARLFAEQQHSLSSLPTSVPVATSSHPQPLPQRTQLPHPIRPQLPTYTPSMHTTAPKPLFTPSYTPEVKTPKQPSRPQPKAPRPAKETKSEEGIGPFGILGILFIVFMLLRGCQ